MQALTPTHNDMLYQFFEDWGIKKIALTTAILVSSPQAFENILKGLLGNIIHPNIPWPHLFAALAA